MNSHKHRDKLRDKQVDRLIESISLETIETRTGLNQESTLKCHRDTRWALIMFHLWVLFKLFSPMIDVLEVLRKDASDVRHKTKATITL